MTKRGITAKTSELEPMCFFSNPATRALDALVERIRYLFVERLAWRERQIWPSRTRHAVGQPSVGDFHDPRGERWTAASRILAMAGLSDGRAGAQRRPRRRPRRLAGVPGAPAGAGRARTRTIKNGIGYRGSGSIFISTFNYIYI